MKISYYLPDNILTNKDLEKLYNSPAWTETKIFRKTGIRERHFASPTEKVSDMVVAAAKSLFSENGLSPKDIGFVLLCTQSPDFLLPTTACIVQDLLGIPTTAGALDFNLGCSGFVYGLSLAKGLLTAKVTSSVLLLTADLYTKHINPFDRSTRTIFGDAATATYLTMDDILSIGEFSLGTDGSGSKNLIIPSSAMSKVADGVIMTGNVDDSGNIRDATNLYMNGPEIYAFTLRTVPQLINDVLTINNLNIEKVDYFVFHQANKFMLDSLRDKLDIPESKFCIDLDMTANTVSSTIPIALKRSLQSGYLAMTSKPQNILIAGFGVGYSWGATVIKI